LGNFDDVAIIDVMVKVGDTVEVDAPLITLETDKATMDVPSSAAGTIAELLVEKGGRVSKGTLIARVETAAGASTASAQAPPPAAPAAAAPAAAAPAPAAAPPAAPAAAGGGGRVEVTCPDLGNFEDVAIIDVMVKAGDRVEVDTPLITLETDKATMDVPSSAAGTIAEMLVAKGGRVSKGTPIARLDTGGAAGSASAQAASPPAAGASAAAPAAAPTPAAAAPALAVAAPAASGSEPAADRQVQLLVLGAGPGGYTAAFRAADLGLSVTLVERWATLGGVCLNVGCIPSKALLHAARVIEETREMGAHGISFGAPQLDLDKLRGWKASVVKKLTGGLTMLAKQRKVEVVRGVARFLSPHVIEITHEGKSQKVRFDQCIIAAGSEAVKLPFIPEDPRIIDSTGALELPGNSGRLLVIGGGIIGLEMACVYDALGVKVSVVELTPQLMPGCDLDLVKPLEKRLKARYEKILLNTKVAAVDAAKDGIRVRFESKDGATTETYDRVLVAVGRTPNGRVIAADKAGVAVNERGFIPVDRQQRTNVPHIFAIGDVVGQPMLAHKATHEAKVAAEVAAGHKSAFDARVIPSVAYTDPEVAWVGATETSAKADNIPFEKASFPWVASGRALSLGRDEGFTKLLFDPATHRVIGGGIVGPNAGDLITEVALAIEMGADAADIGLTVHPHPTLSETVAMAAEAFEGTLTDLYMPKKR
jgi:dihydrolipoamide dehydrogenase